MGVGVTHAGLRREDVELSQSTVVCGARGIESCRIVDCEYVVVLSHVKRRMQMESSVAGIRMPAFSFHFHMAIMSVSDHVGIRSI